VLPEGPSVPGSVPERNWIGVSNYSPAQIDLLVRTGGEAPVLNQIPFGPNDWDADLVAAHVERGVVVEGYSDSAAQFRHAVV
jgi:diketogulonate reductase-like aldo/keto reductase